MRRWPGKRSGNLLVTTLPVKKAPGTSFKSSADPSYNASMAYPQPVAHSSSIYSKLCCRISNILVFFQHSERGIRRREANSVQTPVRAQQSETVASTTGEPNQCALESCAHASRPSRQAGRGSPAASASKTP